MINLDMIPHSIAALSILGAVVCLGFLFVIDLKYRLLPNTYVLALALFGLAFHGAFEFTLLSPIVMLGGLILGGGFLYVIRFFANRIYQQDTMGLGDVKFMMAAGLWLGFHEILLALIIGSFAGILHGVGLAFFEAQKTGTKMNLSRFSLPAGPGFIIGVVVVAVYHYHGVFGL